MLHTLKLEEKVAELDMTDGLRARLQSGRIVHLRPSGNAPEFRCYVEEHSQDAAQALLHNIMPLLRHAT